VAITCVVDQHVHRAVAILHCRNHPIDGIEIGNVQHHPMSAFGRQRFEGCQR
jgi:hypothetical protein